MVKLTFLAHLPSFDIVALRTIISELALVRVGVTGSTSRRLAEERFRWVFVLDEGLQVGQHVRGRVTLLTRNAGVLAFEFVAGQAVIKLFFRRLPVNQAEIFTIVFEVAADTILAIRIAHLHLRVITVFVI